MSVLVIAEHHQGQLKPSTLNAVSAATKLSSDIVVAVFGHAIDGVVTAAQKINAVTKVLSVNHATLEHQLPELVAPILKGLVGQYSHVLIPATAFGKNLLPRLAGLLDVQPVSDVIEILAPDTFKRPVYAGNAIATVQSSDAIKLLSIRTTAFDASDIGGNAPVEALADIGVNTTATSKFVSAEMTVSERPELTAAKIVVSGGRGVGSKENFAIIEKLADKLGGAVGASRAAVDAGYAPNDCQVGQTGKVVAPQLYMAIGISGAIQHLAGMKDSKVIVAINKDPDAPIFAVADYGLVADLFTSIDEIMAKT